MHLFFFIASMGLAILWSSSGAEARIVCGSPPAQPASPMPHYLGCGSLTMCELPRNVSERLACKDPIWKCQRGLDREYTIAMRTYSAEKAQYDKVCGPRGIPGPTPVGGAADLGQGPKPAETQGKPSDNEQKEINLEDDRTPVDALEGQPKRTPVTPPPASAVPRPRT
jgi:hypothetical protein